MIYLISMGLDSEQSFTIMESVRKGKGLKEEWKEEMRAHNVPEWYIDSCLKIKYMFPKAHAAAYVMMAWRIAYCKVFYPLAYYAAYFSIRATGFNYEIMCQGKERLEYFYKDYTRRIYIRSGNDLIKFELYKERFTCLLRNGVRDIFCKEDTLWVSCKSGIYY